MADAEVLEPVPRQEAFHRRDSGALQSQAAFLLLLGRQPGHRGTVTRDDVAWSGIYSDRARESGADELLRWVGEKRLDHVFAHSHGGSVAMIATRLGLEINKLVLLSCPVYRRYSPDFRYANDVVSIRARLDLVILADGGGQQFRDSRIKEHVLPVWFSHKATRDPRVWKRHAIANKL